MTTDQRADTYRFFSIAFGAAPGVEYLQQMETAYGFGMTTKQVVNVFTTKTQFTSVYAATLSNTDFANNIVDSIVVDSASAANKASAKQTIAGALDAGWTRGDIVYQLFDNLSKKAADDADWAGTAKLMQNRVAVATYVSEYQPLNTTDLATLQSPLHGITATTDTSSTQAIKTLLSGNNVVLPTASVLLTIGNDTYTGTTGADSIDGLTGNDVINGGDGNDIIYGGSGNDTLHGDKGQDYIESGDGADTIKLGVDPSSEYVYGYYPSVGNYVPGYYHYIVDAFFDYADGGDGADTIYGSMGSDTIYGGEGADTIYGDGNSYYSQLTAADGIGADVLSRMYNDTIYGGGGDDRIYGEYGNDTIYGGDGDDTIYSGAGDDYVEGGAGKDYIYNESGSDVIYAGDGDDTVNFYHPTASKKALIDGGAGNDTINLTISSTDVNSIVAINAGEGADTININTTSDATISLDLTESVQSKDVVAISWNSYDGSRPLSPVMVKGFSLATDKLDIGFIDMFGTLYNGAYASQSLNYDGTIYKNYAQQVSSPATPWLLPSGSSTGVDSSGKGVFVIKGASASSADLATVAVFLDPYGNNATYGKSADHYFVFDIAGKGMAVYLFTDDTGANNRIVSDELTPLVVLTGLSTSLLDVTQAGLFLI